MALPLSNNLGRAIQILISEDLKNYKLWVDNDLLEQLTGATT
jgi:hypothetical protein